MRHMLRLLGRLLGALIVIIVVLVGCTGAAPTPAPAVPTSPLLPPTITPSPTPIQPSPTPLNVDLVDPSDLVTMPTATPLAPLIGSDIEIDLTLVEAILVDAAQVASVPQARVRWVSTSAMTWYGDDLDCDLTRNVTVQQAVPLFNNEPQAGFQHRVLIGDTIYIYHTLDDRYERCRGRERLADELLIALDPAAADMLAAVQRGVAQQLDLPMQRVQLVTMTPHVWTDTSLGCPLPDQTYSPARIGGYRVLVQAGDQEFLFHTDSITAVPCTREAEQLPS